MKLQLAVLTASLVMSSAALGFDADTAAIIERYKRGKPVAMSDVARLMRASAQWCYDNQDHSCAWTDIYLDVSDTGATFEITNAWDAETDIAFTDRGEFREDRFICEIGHDWVPSVRATRRSDGSLIGGRLLWALKTEIRMVLAGDSPNCFDYLFVSADPDQEVIRLLQRSYAEGEHIAAEDVEVTLHMNSEDAAGLTWRW